MSYKENIPDTYRSAVNGIKTAIEERCGNAVNVTAVEVIQDDKGRDLIVFTLRDPVGPRTARIECAPDEAPRQVALRAYREAGKMIHTDGAR